METVLIITIIYAILATVGAGFFAWMYFHENAKRIVSDAQNVCYKTERDELDKHVSQQREILTQRTDKFLLDIEKLTDKLLKTRGISPIHEIREPKEPVSQRFESTLHRKAREKHDLYKG